jgi:TetR/AcrR family transcriptional regulator, repressor for uid operon
MDAFGAQSHRNPRRMPSTDDSAPSHSDAVHDRGYGASGRGPQARGIATRRALLVAAADQFAVHGFHGATLSAVLAAADVTKGSLYFHFEDKEALAEAVINQMAAGWASVDAAVETHGLDPLHSALTASDLAVVAILEDPIARGGIRLLRDPALPAGATDQHWGTGETALSAHFGAAAAAGLLRPGLDPTGLARSVIAQITGHSVICDRAPRRSGLWDAVTDMWCALLPAIATDAWLAEWDASTWSDRPRPELVTASRRPPHTEVHAIIE